MGGKTRATRDTTGPEPSPLFLLRVAKPSVQGAFRTYNQIHNFLIKGYMNSPHIVNLPATSVRFRLRDNLAENNWYSSAG